MYEETGMIGADTGVAPVPGHMPPPAYQRPGYAPPPAYQRPGYAPSPSYQMPGYAPPPAYQDPAQVHAYPAAYKKILVVAPVVTPVVGAGQVPGVVPRIKHSSLESMAPLSEEEKKTKIKELEEIDEMMNNPEIYRKVINLVKYIMPNGEKLAKMDPKSIDTYVNGHLNSAKESVNLTPEQREKITTVILYNF